MAGQVAQDDDEVIAAINMVPFIDISLVLLIIFMVTSSYIVKAAIEVDLPTAATGSDAAPSTIGLVVMADGKVQLNGAEVSIEQLPALVKAEVAKDAKEAGAEAIINFTTNKFGNEIKAIVANEPGDVA